MCRESSTISSSSIKLPAPDQASQLAVDCDLLCELHLHQWSCIMRNAWPWVRCGMSMLRCARQCKGSFQEQKPTVKKSSFVGVDRYDEGSPLPSPCPYAPFHAYQAPSLTKAPQSVDLCMWECNPLSCKTDGWLQLVPAGLGEQT